jgi:hypothetical protein
VHAAGARAGAVQRRVGARGVEADPADVHIALLGLWGVGEGERGRGQGRRRRVRGHAGGGEGRGGSGRGGGGGAAGGSSGGRGRRGPGRGGRLRGGGGGGARGDATAGADAPPRRGPPPPAAAAGGLGPRPPSPSRPRPRAARGGRAGAGAAAPRRSPGRPHPPRRTARGRPDRSPAAAYTAVRLTFLGWGAERALRRRVGLGERGASSAVPSGRTYAGSTQLNADASTISPVSDPPLLPPGPWERREGAASALARATRQLPGFGVASNGAWAVPLHDATAGGARWGRAGRASDASDAGVPKGRTRKGLPPRLRGGKALERCPPPIRDARPAAGPGPPGAGGGRFTGRRGVGGRAARRPRSQVARRARAARGMRQ